MELEKLSCDATGRRVYEEWDDMKERGWKAARSGAEEVVEGHFGLDDAGMGVALHAVGRNICQVYGFLRARQRLEELPARTHISAKSYHYY